MTSSTRRKKFDSLLVIAVSIELDQYVRGEDTTFENLDQLIDLMENNNDEFPYVTYKKSIFLHTDKYLGPAKKEMGKIIDYFKRAKEDTELAKDVITIMDNFYDTIVSEERKNNYYNPLRTTF